jgi:undecaprenyl-diphosphatase
MRPLLRLATAAAMGYAARDRLVEADRRAFSLVQDRRSERLDRIMPVVTDLGSMYAVAGAAFALYLSGRRKLARDVLGAASLAWAVAQGAKSVYARPRPYQEDKVDVLVREPKGLSYPSGHPGVAGAMAAILAPELPPPARNLVERLPEFVGLSRVYVGVHYPSDVVGGRLIGEAVGDLWRAVTSRG